MTKRVTTIWSISKSSWLNLVHHQFVTTHQSTRKSSQLN